MAVSWLLRRLQFRTAGPKTDRAARRQRHTARPAVEQFEDRCLLSAGLGNVALGLRDLAQVYDAKAQIKDLSDPTLSPDPTLNTQLHYRAAGYLASDLGSLASGIISAIPGADTKTIGQAISTAADFGRLASFLLTNGWNVGDGPGAKALHDVLEARDLISQANDYYTAARNASGNQQTALVQAGNDKLTQAQPFVNDALDSWAEYNAHNPPPQLNAALWYIVHSVQDAMQAVPQLTPDLYIDPFVTNLGIVESGLHMAAMGQALSDVLAVAGDVSALAGGPVGGIVGDLLAASHDFLNVGYDHVEGTDPTSDLLSLAGDGTSLINDTLPAPAPTNQPLSVTVSLPNGPNPSQSGTVATFSDPNAALPGTAYTAFIDWGDGSSSTGQVAATTGGMYVVTGTHLYSISGSYAVNVVVTGDGTQGQGSQTATINPATTGVTAPAQGITVAGYNLSTQGNLAVSGPVATVYAPASGSYAATIAWGDGTTSTGQLVSQGNGTYAVTGSHTYSQPGGFLVNIFVSDGSGNAASGSSQITGALSPATLPGGTVGGPYRQVITAGSGYTYRVTAGSLPPGLTLDPGTGVLAGMPSSFAGSPFSFTVTATDASGDVASQPYRIAIASPLGTSPNAIHVENLYGLLLHRPADPGAAGWVGLLDQGMAPGNMILALENSAEYLTNVMVGIYQHYLDRAPDPAGLSGWVSALQNGLTIEQVIAGFIASPEFYQVQGGGTNTGFVTVFYQDILGRQPDPVGFATWVDALDSGTITPAQMAAGFLTSQEYQGDLISTDYLQFLGRQPDAGGLAAWVQAMQAGATDQQVLAAILGSGEAFTDWS